MVECIIHFLIGIVVIVGIGAFIGILFEGPRQ